MFCNFLSQTIFLWTLVASLLAMSAFGQPKPATEVDIAKCWSYPTPDGGGSVAVSDGAGLYVSGDGGRVVALSLDGKKLWSTELGGSITSNILAIDSGLYLVTSTTANNIGTTGGSTLRSLSKQTGVPNWTLRITEANHHFIGGFNGSLVVISDAGIIQSIDAKTGTLKWRREIAEGFVAEPSLFADKLIVASTAKQVFVISLATGEIDSLRKVNFGVTAVGQTTAGDLIVGDERGNLTSFLGNTEKVSWKFRSGAEISAIITVDDHILVSSHDNFAYSLVARTGSVAWKRRLSGRVSRIATIDDRYALISGFEDHGAVLADLAKGKIVGQIVLDDEESLSQNPLVSGGLIFALTNELIRSFSLDGCGSKKDGGPGK